jgi:hypothetical protein
MPFRYLGQNYDPATPIAPDAIERARAWDAKRTAAKCWIRTQHRAQGDHVIAYQRITRPDYHSSIHHGDALDGRTMEYVRR